LEGLGIFAATDIASHKPTDTAGLVPVRRGQPADVRRPRRLCRHPAFVSVPTEGLLDPAYTAARAKLIADKAVPVSPGQPRGVQARGPDNTREPGGTSHFVIIRRGRATWSR
jgi:gamma-glutamyltranspeptidase/glutathione hydrolase